MYASQRSVNKNSETMMRRREAARKNRLAHKGMSKDHIQITPDGKVIQHYKMDSRTTEIKKAITKAYEEAQKKNAPKDLSETVAEETQE